MLTQTTSQVKPLSASAQKWIIVDTLAIVAQDRDHAEAEHDYAEVDACDQEIRQLRAELDTLTQGRGF